MSKNKKAVSIKTKIIKPMILVLFLQIVIILLTACFGDTTSELRSNSYNLLVKDGEIIKYTVEDIFSKYVISDKDYQAINSKLKLQEINVDTVDNAIIAVGGDLENIIKEMDVEGAFIVLDQNLTRKDEGKLGIYLNKDLTASVGSLKALKELNLRANSSWNDSFKIDQSKSSDFYNKIANVAKIGSVSNYRDYGYWGKPVNKGENGAICVTYTLPLVRDNGTFYGVMGIEISSDIIRKIFNEKYQVNGTCSFIAYGKENTVDAISLIPDDSNMYIINILDHVKNREDIYKVQGVPNSEGESNVVYLSDLKIDSVGKYIKGEDIRVLTTTTEENLLVIQDRILKDLVVGMMIALVCGIIISIFTASFVASPITRLVNNVKRMNPSKEIKLERVGITQVDALAMSIENLGKNVLDNASKLSQIINLVNMPIGAFEYYDNSNMVYCTQSFFSVVGMPVSESEDLFINMEKFKKVLSEITKDRLQNEKNVYRIEQDGKEEYIRVKMLINNQKTLGVVVNVTDDILKKQKIEYERDHDVLTGLLNRIAFKREVANYMANQKNEKVAAFLMWDLDSLKYMNDTFGHELGDKYIKMAADAINKFTKYGGIAGRIGGDEFTAFVGGFETKDEIRQIINKVKRDFDATEIELPNGTKKAMSASMGVAWYPQDSIDYEELCKYADYAMYEVKKSTKGALKEFDINTFKSDYDKYE
ncbi:MAG: GGDEF domain-containing protein [Clostridiales bacterium]|nr:GGDEF domain-containing protein [Clostridiales bacterium]